MKFLANYRVKYSDYSEAMQTIRSSQNFVLTNLNLCRRVLDFQQGKNRISGEVVLAT
jgi:hypothetical protein